MGRRGPKPRDPEARFRALVKVDSVTGCWMWRGHCNNGGYGMFYVAPGKVMTAHQWAYEHWHGPVAEGQNLDHLCRQRACVKVLADECGPPHLEPVAIRENALRGLRGRLRQPPTHCRNGHALTEDNIYLEQRGDRANRLCLTCKRAGARARMARYRARKKATG